MAHGRLTQAKRLLEIAHTRLAILLSLDETEKAEACWVGDHPERGCETLRILSRERFLRERRTAGGGRRDGVQAHGSPILTRVDQYCKNGRIDGCQYLRRRLCPRFLTPSRS